VLAILRVVEIRPQSGVYLRNMASESSFENMVLLEQMGASPSAAEVLEMIEVRYLLETQAMRLACERRTEADLASLRAVLEDERQALRGRRNTYVLDQRFHLGIIASSHNSVLLRLLNPFYQMTLKRRRAFFANPRRAGESAAEHERILQAIERRDAAHGERVIAAHLQRGRLFWSEVLGRSNAAARARRHVPARARRPAAATA
jgi:DNA-binding FadR family transcriptional regulator